MLIRSDDKDWNHKASGEITPPLAYSNRRQWLGLLASGATGATLAGWAARDARAQMAVTARPGKLAALPSVASQVPGAVTMEKLTSYQDASTYNNFYEFGTDKADPARNSSRFQTSPWSVSVEGLVKQPRTFALEDLLKLSAQEERIYRLRCVEGWSMVIPWVGYSLSQLLRRVEPLGSAKFVEFITAADSQTAVDVQCYQGERPMAKDNRILGNFRLDGIPAAPRGVPQVEVTFDIDANGILNVKAKDKATGKEQTITITSSSGLSKADVEKLVKDAQANAAEDARKKEIIEQRNQLDQLVYQTEKLLSEHKEKLPAGQVGAVEEALGEAKTALNSDDAGQLKAAFDKLTSVSHKLAEAAYSQGGGAAGGPDAGGNPGQQGGGAGRKDDDVIDADFEEA
jgi:hypothetical protein